MLHLCSAGPRPGKVGQCTNAQRMLHVKVSKGAELSDTKHAQQGIGLLRQQLRAGCDGMRDGGSVPAAVRLAWTEAGQDQTL